MGHGKDRRMDRNRTLNGIAGAARVGGAATGGAKGAATGRDGGAGAKAPETPPQGSYKRSDGTMVPMASMNPHHRAAAARKADLAGDKELAQALRASGTIPE